MPLSVPKFLTKAFAAAGGKADVPMTGADINNGRADYENGFPPVTRAPIQAGGIPPWGVDFNGVLFDLSSAVQYLQAGMVFPYSQDLADAIGGYAEKAVVADPSDIRILWQNNIANNTLTPSVPNGWTQVFNASDLFRDPTDVLRGAPLLSTQLQAEAGTDNTAMMSALRVFQAIRSAAANATESLRGVLRVGTQSEVNAGTLDDVAVTPKKMRAGFSINLGANGHISFPTWMGGLIIQWGAVIASASADTTVVYPMVFPTNYLTLQAQVNGNTSNLFVVATVEAETQVGFSCNAISTGGRNALSISWFAVGY